MITINWVKASDTCGSLNNDNVPEKTLKLPKKLAFQSTESGSNDRGGGSTTISSSPLHLELASSRLISGVILG